MEIWWQGSQYGIKIINCNYGTYITVKKLSEILELSLLRTKRAAFRSCSVSLYEKQSGQRCFFLSIYLCD